MIETDRKGLKNMKNLKKISAVIICAVLCLALVGCGRKAAEDRSDYYYDEPSPSNYYYDSDGGSYAPDMQGNEYYPGDHEKNAELYGLKMTYRAEVHLETKDAEKCEADLMKAISSCGGYISSQSSEGGYTTTYGNYVSRYTRLVVKVPADKLDQFLQGMEGYANVVSASRSAEDITAQYMDTEARLSSLETQKSRLEELMKEAGSLSELLEVEDRLAYVIYQIESYTAQMNSYKDLVAFSTVTVVMEEVSVITKQNENFFQRLWSAFRGGWSGFASDAGDFFVGMVEHLPYIIIAVIVIVLAVRKIRKVRAAKRAKAE